MANLNLSTANEKINREAKILSGGLLGVLIIFFLVVLLYFGLSFWRNSLAEKIESNKLEYTQKTETLKRGNSKSVVDFQNRLNISKELIQEEENLTEYFANMEKAIVPPVYLESYKYDEASRTITVEAIADDYNMVAKQILGFKSSPSFSKVSAGQSKLDSKTGKIFFTVLVTVDNKNKDANK